MASADNGCPIFYSHCPSFVTLRVSQILHPLSRSCYGDQVFEDLAPEVVASHQATIAANALWAARLVASTWLATGPGFGLPTDQITEVLLARDSSDPHYLRLAPFEKRWSLLVIRLLREAMDPTAAVDDAHARGASWADIGTALGIARQTAHNRFGDKVGG